ncbi:branched-chain amino acid transferase [bacterium M00.F.Ca.ET.228.01.1.1]|uniref:aminotransferase class IV n=1 Tax=Paraburkholderia phenoliruptrix TaxID=252970 RepID=UPI001092FC4B|nr:aminotransferase class IV [Paraburkholderia phenoliruptrix]TGP41470.1 branched-chain amino acid transferase [bacterium M00.F.Ca.ET.228.01.1.1]TGR98127.1 branched-chain amino acid transferase [bacterium M00.F.Ca.ET.191.01.1.1]TGU02318.1 branched-chain amino acid transferase [bacterium M00.F.Ca.ET.155.01.1.1]MBW0447116.1 aminotransferase class IV [Paraburkholderia phenoliruptrix]MBW9101501.1 aminotransferase class IV [Paraburkholderia phenoliruptrix]
MSDFSNGVAFVEGVYMPVSEAAIPILDRGFVRSDATYDVAHVWKGSFFRLGDHIDRFFESMRSLRMSLPYSKEQIERILTECVRKSGLRDAYVQMTCTRGVPARGSRDPRECINRFYAFAQPFVWIANEEQRECGLSMIVSSVQRIPPAAVDPRVKNFHWLDLTMGIFEAYDRGAIVAVLGDGNGHVTEGAGFNVFLVKDGVLATPDSGVFEGMTRRTVIELAALLDRRCEVRPVSVEELRRADEIFLSSTAGGIMPVTVLDGEPVGGGRVGGMTRQFASEYWGRQEAGWLCTPIDYSLQNGEPAPCF